MNFSKWENLLEKAKIVVVVIALVLILVELVSYFIFGVGALKNYSEYECDVKNFRFSTEIIIREDDKKIAKVKGNIFRIVEDPLTMRDMAGNRIAFAGDDYHFVAQDSHVIIAEGKVAAEMVGRFKIFGDKYDIYDAAGKKLATVNFNWSDTYGEMRDAEGRLIAEYSSFICFNDFDVRISPDCRLDENIVLMIFASYYSDQAFDSTQ